MNDYLVIRMDGEGSDLHIVGFDKRRTEGLAHQLATRITDAGFKVRIIPPEDAVDAEYYLAQLDQKRKMGYIEEYGIIPNGNRSRGEGARGIGRMIFPAIPGWQEGSLLKTDQGKGQPEIQGQSAPLSFSSNDLENITKNNNDTPRQFKIKIGGRLIN